MIENILTQRERYLRDRINELEELNRQLKEKLTPQRQFPIYLRLTNLESKLLSCLCVHPQKIVSREHIYISLWSDIDGIKNVKSIDVIIFKLRKKLSTYNIEIKTLRGIGYFISKEMCNKLELLVEGEK